MYCSFCFSGEAIAQRFWVRAMSELPSPYQSSRKLDLGAGYGGFSGPVVPDGTRAGWLGGVSYYRYLLFSPRAGLLASIGQEERERASHSVEDLSISCVDIL